MKKYFAIEASSRLLVAEIFAGNFIPFEDGEACAFYARDVRKRLFPACGVFDIDVEFIVDALDGLAVFGVSGERVGVD